MNTMKFSFFLVKIFDNLNYTSTVMYLVCSDSSSGFHSKT